MPADPVLDRWENHQEDHDDGSRGRSRDDQLGGADGAPERRRGADSVPSSAPDEDEEVVDAEIVDGG